MSRGLPILNVPRSLKKSAVFKSFGIVMSINSCDFYRQAALMYAISNNNADAATRCSTSYYPVLHSAESNNLLQSVSCISPSKSATPSPAKNQSEEMSITAPGGFIVNQIAAEDHKAVGNQEVQTFDEWCASLKKTEASSDLHMIRTHFRSFLKIYPLCYGYWRRLALLEMKLGKNLKAADEIFVEGLEVNPQCVELWIARIELYQKEGKLSRASNDDDKENRTLNYNRAVDWNFYTEKNLRSIFETGLEKICGEWSSAPYWRVYIQFEIKNENWEQVGCLYYRVFSSDYLIGELPQLMQEFQEYLATYKNDFKRLIHPNEMNGYNAVMEQFEAKEELIKKSVEQRREEEKKEREKRFKTLSKQQELKVQRLIEKEKSRKSSVSSETLLKLELEYQKEKATLIKELEEKVERNQKNEFADAQSRLIRQQKEILIKGREAGYKSSMNLIEKRKPFESSIRRLHFHPKPLDPSQLSAWRNYLDFEINESSSSAPERVVQLFRRCLVVCNNYIEFWFRCVDWFVDVKNDTEGARQCLLQARTVYLPNSTSIWIKSAEVEECCDLNRGSDAYERARNYLIQIDRLKGWADCEIILHRIYFERRHGRMERCHELFQSAVSPTPRKNNTQNTTGTQPEQGGDGKCQEDCTDDEPTWRSNLSATARVKLALFYAYFLVEVDGDVELSREILKKARELRCSRQSLLLVSVDIETQAKVLALGNRKQQTGELCKSTAHQKDSLDYIHRVSQLYEELLQESSIISADLVSALWHRYVTFLITQGAPIQTIRSVKVRALSSLSEIMK